jgi:hypothetical protein
MKALNNGQAVKYADIVLQVNRELSEEQIMDSEDSEIQYTAREVDKLLYTLQSSRKCKLRMDSEKLNIESVRVSKIVPIQSFTFFTFSKNKTKI